jgi:hypothetical protein
LEIRKYCIPKEGREFYGYSQLEPITKYLIGLLKYRNQKLDKIVVMASEEAQFSKNNYPVTACEMYKFRICDYLINLTWVSYLFLLPDFLQKENLS